MSNRTRESHYAFAAMEAIRGGVWDDWLHLLHAAMIQRQETPEYKAVVLSHAEFVAGYKAESKATMLSSAEIITGDKT